MAHEPRKIKQEVYIQQHKINFFMSGLTSFTLNIYFIYGVVLRIMKELENLRSFLFLVAP